MINVSFQFNFCIAFFSIFPSHRPPSLPPLPLLLRLSCVMLEAARISYVLASFAGHRIGCRCHDKRHKNKLKLVSLSVYKSIIIIYFLNKSALHFPEHKIASSDANAKLKNVRICKRFKIDSKSLRATGEKWRATCRDERRNVLSHDVLNQSMNGSRLENILMA